MDLPLLQQYVIDTDTVALTISRASIILDKYDHLIRKKQFVDGEDVDADLQYKLEIAHYYYVILSQHMQQQTDNRQQTTHNTQHTPHTHNTPTTHPQHPHPQHNHSTTQPHHNTTTPQHNTTTPQHNTTTTRPQHNTTTTHKHITQTHKRTKQQNNHKSDTKPETQNLQMPARKCTKSTRNATGNCFFQVQAFGEGV
jgi:hypothetical protein